MNPLLEALLEMLVQAGVQVVAAGGHNVIAIDAQKIAALLPGLFEKANPTVPTEPDTLQDNQSTNDAGV